VNSRTAIRASAIWANHPRLGKPVQWLLHSGLLFAAMVAAFAVAWTAGFLVTLGAVVTVDLIYSLWPLIGYRDRWKRLKIELGDFREFTLQLVCTVSASIGIIALILASLLTWLYRAYNWERIIAIYAGDPDGPALPFEPTDYLPGMSKAAILLTLAALLLGLAFAIRLWAERTNAGTPTHLNGGSGKSHVLSLWISGFIGLGASAILPIVIGPAILFYHFLDMVRWDRIPTIWDLFVADPVLPLGLLASAGILVSWRHILLWEGSPADEPPDGEPGRGETNAVGMPVRIAVAIVGIAAPLAALIVTIHFMVVLLTAAIPALSAGAGTGRALAQWADGLKNSGRPDAKIVATINELGHWSPDAPGEGLARLLPDLVEDPDDGIARWNCTVTVTAGTMEAAEREAQPWLETLDHWTYLGHDVTRRFDEEMDRSASESEQAEEDNDETTPMPPVRYCITATCPSPLAWQAPDAVAMYSSHPSASPHWLFNARADVLLEGREASAGGYCTETGELADSYQG